MKNQTPIFIQTMLALANKIPQISPKRIMQDLEGSNIMVIHTLSFAL